MFLKRCDIELPIAARYRAACTRRAARAAGAACLRPPPRRRRLCRSPLLERNAVLELNAGLCRLSA
eukprot:COSAG05_NODE_16699_length_340_cov_1.381743_1_plen_65_part_01